MIDLTEPLPPRRERRAKAKANKAAFVPLAPPPVDVPQLSEMDKMEEALLDMIDSLNALTPDGKPAWFILGPYIFHENGDIYYHNGNPLMEAWNLCNEAQADTARAYLKARMYPDEKEGMPS